MFKKFFLGAAVALSMLTVLGTASSESASAKHIRSHQVSTQGDRLVTHQVGNRCEYQVMFDLTRREASMRAIRVTGPRGTNPRLPGNVNVRGHVRFDPLFVTYNTERGRCHTDRRHYARQFTLFLR